MRVSAGLGGASELVGQFFKVPLHLYRPGDLIEEDIYFLYQGNFLLYRLKNLIWKQEDETHLKQFDLSHLYIRLANPGDHHRFLEAKLKTILNEPKIPSLEKATVLYETSKAILSDFFNRPESADCLRRSMNSIQHSIDFLGRDKNHFFDLMSLATSSFSEFTHGLHVAAYTITLARQMGIKAFNQISALGVAAILHDIGKSRIDSKILEKEGRLNDSERFELERHPVYSYEIIHRFGSTSSLSEKMILQHHERPGGRGYPAKTSEDLHVFQKIISICDCFDVMTSDRPYQQTMKPKDAILAMQSSLKDDYDQKILTEFIKMLRR